MDTTEIALMQQMTENERLLFTSEMNAARKGSTTAIVLAVCLGGLGAHRFYLREPGLGLLYLVFCWTFVPAIVALIEAFVLTDRVNRYNAAQAHAIAAKIRMLHRPAPALT